MYAPRPTSTETRPDYATTLAATNRVLRGAQRYVEEYRQLTSRDADTPLNGLERLAFAATCSALADVFDLAAGMWGLHRPGMSIAVGYRSAAQHLRDEAALNEAMAEIAPSVPGIRW